MSRTSMLGLIAGLAACSSNSADGQLIDAMTGEGIAGVRIIATAQDPTASITCTSFEAETDEAGAFRITGLCGGTYGLKTADDTLWLADIDTVPDGGAADLKLQVWRAPPGSGIYRLSDGKLEPLRTSSDLSKDRLWGTDETLMWPAKVPSKAPVIGPGDHLVQVGKDTLEQTRIAPLIPSGPRWLGEGSERYQMSNVSFIGARFEGDDLERVEATVDSAKVVTREKGDRAARFVPGSALPAGRYALYRDKGRTVTIVDFGSTQQPAEEPVADGK